MASPMTELPCPPRALPTALLLLTVAAACGVDPAGSAPEPVEPPPAATSQPAPEAPPPPADAPTFVAGAASADVTPQVGAPLGGFGARRKGNIDLDPSNAVTFFEPSTGVRDPLSCRALYLSDGKAEVAFLAIDVIAVTSEAVTKIATRQQALGGTLDAEELLVFGSHTHSGSGALTSLRLWEQAAMDLYVPSVEAVLVDGCASALATAQKNARPARVGSRTGKIAGATRNRRAEVSPYVTTSTVDEDVALLRVDGVDGQPIAALWNFAIHGTALGPDNLLFSADVMGAANAALASALPGVTFLFANGAEGDIAPSASGEQGMTTLGSQIAEAVRDVYLATPLDAEPSLRASSATVDFPGAALVLSDVAGDLDLGPVKNLLGGGSGVTVALGPQWIETQFRFQAVRVGRDAVFVSIPGEAIYEIGQALKSAGKGHGARDVFAVGLANGHMGYITSGRELEAGGYEATMTFFGPDTGTKVVNACLARIAAVFAP